jgi:hypothetical protein
VSSYWRIVRKEWVTASLKRKHQIAVSGELALEELWTCKTDCGMINP